jgi:hypothetical protein
MALNFEYLSRIRPLNGGETQEFDNPDSRMSNDAREVTGLGRMPSNSGNVEDFNDKNSELSRGTASLLSSMRMQREAEKLEKATPLSEKLFRIEMANRKAKQKAAMYMEERKLRLQEEKIQYDRIKDASELARAEADKEEIRANNAAALSRAESDKAYTRSKDKEKSDLDFNTGYVKFLQDTKQDPSPETRAEYESMMKPGQSVQAVQPAQSVQTPQIQTGETQPKTTMRQLKSKWVDKEKEKAIKSSIIKLQEKTGRAFTPEEEQLPDEDKYNILLNETKKGGEGLDKDKLTQLGKIRDDFSTSSKDFIKIRDSYERIKSSTKQTSAAGDLALIFNYMKMLDPGSTVREGEFATAQNSAGLPDRVRAMYNKIINGERLAKDQRADFTDRAKDFYTAQENTQKKTEKRFRDIATKDYGFTEDTANRNISEVYSGMDNPVEGTQPQPQQTGNQQQPNAGTQQSESGITKEQAIAELKRRGRL